MGPSPFIPGTQILVAMMVGVPFGLCLVDKSGTIHLPNDTAEKVFGRSRTRLISASIETMLPERFQEGCQEKLERYFEAAKLVS